MNSDIKKLLILGGASILISALSLYSFKDIKFKNTQKTIEAYKQQIEIQQNQNNSYNPDNYDTDTIYDITTGSISIFMPNFLDSSGFNMIINELSENGIDVNIEYASGMNDLKWAVKQGLLDYDLYLLPSDWILGLDLESINLGENIKPYFIQIFQDNLSENENIFIPYSLDPYITIKKRGVNDVNTWSKLYSYISLWTQSRAYSMPLIWGIGKSDIQFLEEGTGPFENYFEILYWQLKLIKDKRDKVELDNLLNVENTDLEFKYDYDLFSNIYTRLISSNQYCAYYPATCMLAHNFADIKFGFISDFDVLQKYFTGKSYNFVASEFTNSDQAYPVRGRGFVIPKGNSKIGLSLSFIKQYIANAIGGDNSIWGNTIPAINNIYTDVIGNNLYEDILRYSDKFVITWGDVNLQNDFVSDPKNMDLLRGFYSTDVYINN